MSSDSVGIEVVGNWTKISGKETSGKYKGEPKGKWKIWGHNTYLFVI